MEETIERKLTDSQKDQLASALYAGWVRYTSFLGEPPHGTKKQMSALVELLNLGNLLKDVQGKAIAKWYAEGQR